MTRVAGIIYHVTGITAVNYMQSEAKKLVWLLDLLGYAGLASADFCRQINSPAPVIDRCI